MTIVIDKTDGSLHFDGKIIGCSTSLHTLRNLGDGRFRLQYRNGPHSRYRIALAHHLGNDIGIYVQLTDMPARTVIRWYGLWVHDRSIPWGEYASWDDWSEERELADLEKLVAILSYSGMRNPQYFKWGSVSASYDQRSGGSSLVVSYSQT